MASAPAALNKALTRPTAVGPGRPRAGPRHLIERCEARTYESLPDGDHHAPLAMANVVQPHPKIDFHSSTLGRPPQMGLGLTLSMSSSLVGFPHAHTNVVQPLPPTINPSRPQKRRFEQDDEQADQSFSNSPGARDVAMERSPTPERPKRPPPKRPRNSLTIAQDLKGGKIPKGLPNSSVENQDVDVGVLLGQSNATLDGHRIEPAPSVFTNSILTPPP